MRLLVKQSLILLFAFLSIQVIRAQIVIQEISADGLVEIVNQGDSTVNISNYWLCDRPQYERLGGLTVECGSLNLSPGELVVINTASIEVDPNADELGLYSNDNFSSAESIVDFVIWGDPSGATRETVAAEAGIWTLGERASSFSVNMSLHYDGDGNMAADYAVGESTICVMNTCDVDGGIISAVFGDTLTICAGDGMTDEFDVTLNGNTGDASQWIITDTDLTILALPDGPPFDFEDAGAGINLIWHLSYAGDIIGLMVDSSAADLEGCIDLSNAITVISLSGEDCPMSDSCEVMGGLILNPDGGEGEIVICTDDDIDDVIEITLDSAMGDISAWVITDTAGLILAIQNSGVFSFDGSESGICLIWHVSASGELTGFEIGALASEIQGCYSLSNPIEIIKQTGDECSVSIECDVIAGELSSSLGDTIMIIQGDSISDLVDVMVDSTAVGDSALWLITNTDLTILSIPDGPPFDFSSVTPRTYLIWSVSYSGELTGVTAGENAMDIQGCFATSDPIVVVVSEMVEEMCDVDGGMIASSLGDTINILIGDDAIELIDVSVDNSAKGENSAWVITDTELNIVGLPFSPPFEFEELGEGTFLIWHLSFDGELAGVALGSNASSISGCFDFSDNAIVVISEIEMMNNCDVAGGVIVNPDGDDSGIVICTDDDFSDELTFGLTDASGEISAWVVTDTSGVILAIQEAATFDFEGSEAGVCLVWHVSASGELMGFEIGALASEILGCYSLSNPIEVVKQVGADCPGFMTCDAEGGILSSTLGDTILITLGDTVPDQVDAMVDSSAVGESSIWLLTDTAFIILETPEGPVFDFAEAEVGTYLLWNVSYNDELIGAEIGANALEIEGCFGTTNPLVIIVTQKEEECVISGGTISTENGDEFAICTGDGKSDAFDVALEGATGANSAWVFTDADGKILALPSSPPFNLENSGGGVINIWHLSFEDGLQGAQLSGNVADLSGCFALSNAITVVRNQVIGGELTTVSGDKSIAVCSGDEIGSAFDLSIKGSIGDDAAWIITDTSGTILEYDAITPFDFEGQEEGVVLIWHISFNGDLSGTEIGANATEIAGCFALSNPVSVNISSVAGGSLTTTTGETEVSVCIDDDQDEPIEVNITGSKGSNSAFVITDEAGMIQQILASSPFSLETGSGSSFIWHLSFEDGLIGAEIGANANELEGCFALSNPIKVNRLSGDACPAPCDIQGGSLSITDGTTELTICSGDGIPDPFSVVLEGATGSINAWVITDAVGNILGLPISPPFDLDPIGEGVALVYSLSFEPGARIPSIGGRLDQLNGCFALSNPITVTRLVGDDCPAKCEVEGGAITFEDGSETIVICSDDGEADQINAVLTGSDAPNSLWVITDEVGKILALPETLPFNFEGTGSGTCFLWHMGFDDNFGGANVGDNANDLTGCFDLSNSLSVVRTIGEDCEECNVDGGIITSQDGLLNINVCPQLAIILVGHSIDDEYKDAPYYYVVTDQNNVIIDWQHSTERNVDLRNLDDGIYKIFGWSTRGDREPNLGDPIGSLNIGCGELSPNHVNVSIEDSEDCSTGCHAPRNVRVVKVSDTRFTVQWQRVKDADSYIVRLKYTGSDRVLEVPTRGRKIFVNARPDQMVEIEVAAVCDGSISPFSPTVMVNTDTKSNKGKNNDPKGLFDVSEFEITEQATIYPNPAYSLMSVYIDSGNEISTLAIHDMSGREMKRLFVSSNVETQLIDVSDLIEGIYILTITTDGDQVIREKFVKTSGR